MRRRASWAVVALAVTAVLFLPAHWDFVSARFAQRPALLSTFNEVPVEQPMREIFGVRSFISQAEWQEVRDTVSRGGTAFVRTPGGRLDAVFLQKSDDSRYDPILVRVIGAEIEDGSRLARSGLWLADYRADGTIDRAVHYGPRASDGSRQTVVYYRAMAYGQPGLILTTTDIATTDFQYMQDLDQWRSAFRGDAHLYMFYYNRMRRELIPLNEAPFCFFDVNRDGYSEVAIRFHMPAVLPAARSYFLWPRLAFDLLRRDDPIRSVRYSFDADGDAGAGKPYDYDFSVSAVGHVAPPAAALTTFRVGEMATLPAVDCRRAEELVAQVQFSALSLTWDEADANHDPQDPERRERWEGVINRGSEAFPQVGGPASAAANNRTEIADGGRERIALYYSPIDKRIHLRGARTGWLRVDYDFDGKVDMVVEYRDTDADGVFDRWMVDVDADGVFDRIYDAQQPEARALPLSQRQLSDFWRAARRQTLFEYRALIAAMNKVSKSPPSRAEQAYADHGGSDRERGTGGGDRDLFYLHVIAELRFHELRQRLRAAGVASSTLAEIESLFGAGRFSALTALLEGLQTATRH